MRQIIRLTLGLWLSLGLAAVSGAQTPISGGDGLFYYEIGGARAVAPSPNPRFTQAKIGGSVELRLGYSCGQFDPVLSASNILDDVSRGVEKFYDALVLAAKAAIANLPAYILQRANPGLYDLFQNALLKAEETVNLATKSCQQMEAEIAQGQDPYREWIKLSMGNRWRMVVGTEGDVVKAKETIEDEGGDGGVPWIGGLRGGRGQQPIAVIGDTIAAGYNLLLNRSPDASGAPVARDPEPRLVHLWPNPEAARQWAVSVLGESHITTCGDCPRQSAPGIGLHQKIREENERIAESLAALVEGDDVVTPAALEALAAPGVAINQGVIDALRALPVSDRGATLDRLLDEITTARVIEKALLARRLLLSGQRVPEVEAAEVAGKAVDAAVTEIEREIDNLMFERNVRQQLVSTTARVLLNRHRDEITRSYSQPTHPPADDQRLQITPYATQISIDEEE